MIVIRNNEVQGIKNELNQVKGFLYDKWEGFKSLQVLLDALDNHHRYFIKRYKIPTANFRISVIVDNKKGRDVMDINGTMYTQNEVDYVINLLHTYKKKLPTE